MHFHTCQTKCLYKFIQFLHCILMHIIMRDILNPFLHLKIITQLSISIRIKKEKLIISNCINTSFQTLLTLRCDNFHILQHQRYKSTLLMDKNNKNGKSVDTSKSPFYRHGLTLILAWISNHIPSKVRDGNFTGWTEWLNNFAAHFMDVIAYPFWD